MPVITLDVDWAPDFAIDYAAEMLVRAGVRATWFVTHDSPATRRLRDHPGLFELGIHPNFLPGSTHGANEDEVLRHCMSLVPGARVMRTHGLVQTSNLLLKVVEQTSVRVDASLLLPHGRGLAPVAYHWGSGRHLVRVPYMWEDDFEALRPAPRWDLHALIDEWDGLAVLDFHPIHVYLNSSDMTAYGKVRRLGHLSALVEAVVKKHVCVGAGAGTAFRSAIARMQGRQATFLADFDSGG